VSDLREVADAETISLVEEYTKPEKKAEEKVEEKEAPAEEKKEPAEEKKEPVEEKKAEEEPAPAPERAPEELTDEDRKGA